MSEGELGDQHTCICIRKEDGRQSGDSGDTIVFANFFPSPLFLQDGDKREVVTARSKKGTRLGALTEETG